MGDGGAIQEDDRADHQLRTRHEQHLPPQAQRGNETGKRHERADDGRGGDCGARPRQGGAVYVDEVAGCGDGQ